MKRLLFTFLVLAICNNCFAQITAKDVLNATVNRLSAIKQVSYYHQRETNYLSENYRNTLSGECYFDFTDNNPLTHFRFSFKDNNTFIFNGTEFFSLNNKEKTMQITAKPQLQQFQATSFLYNSVVSLRNTLPLVLTDPNIKLNLKDTVLDDQPHFKLTLTLTNRKLAYINGFDSLKVKVAIVKFYDVLVNKATNLPAQVIERSNINDDYVRTTFTKLDPVPPAPNEASWFYSSYQPEYAVKAAFAPVLIKPNTSAPMWKLPVYDKGADKNINLSTYKGKLTLISFWIKNCGYCIASIPELNALYKKYQSKINIIGVNAYDSRDDVAFFVKKYKPEYIIAYNGQTVAEAYGVGGYPSIVFLDNKGTVLYAAAGINERKMDELIRKHLQ